MFFKTNGCFQQFMVNLVIKPLVRKPQTFKQFSNAFTFRMIEIFKWFLFEN